MSLPALTKLVTYARFDPYLVLMKLGLTGDSDGPGNSFAAFIARRRINRYNLQPLFEQFSSSDKPELYKLFVSGHKQHDVINLYHSLVTSGARTVVEFGSGVSTIFMAHALRRNHAKGKVYSVEADARWAEVVTQHLKSSGLESHAEVRVATPRLEFFLSQPVASFDALPDVRPDLIYVDGPDPAHVMGSVQGLTMSGLQFIVLKDPLAYEWALYAGAKIIVDGRLHNFRFLRTHLKRAWRSRRRLLTNINELHLIR